MRLVLDVVELPLVQLPVIFSSLDIDANWILSALRSAVSLPLTHTTKVEFLRLSQDLRAPENKSWYRSEYIVAHACGVSVVVPLVLACVLCSGWR